MTIPAWVAIVSTVGTWIIAIAAIFGERIRSWLFRPDLKIDLVSTVGEFITQAMPVVGQTTQYRLISSRYFHLHITNSALFPAAHEVEALLTQFDKRGPDGKPQRQWSGSLPLNWQHGLYPRARTVGHATQAIADLFFVNEDGILQLIPTVQPNNLQATMSGEQHIWLSLIARGLNGESKILRLKIDWDGKWDRGDNEMGQHLRVAIDPQVD